MRALNAAALDALSALFDDADAVQTGADALDHYGRDWTRVQSPAPGAVVFPRSIDDVSAVMRWATAHEVAVVPSGGRTGLAGGAVAAHGEVVLSLEKMRRLGPIDVVGRTVVVDAGAVTADVHAHAATAGLFWPVDFASKGSSQIGGNLSTNAGGVRVVRYGSSSKWVLGMDVVLANGDQIRCGGALEKDNTGFDLGALFMRTEGTLGIICSATLKLCPLPGPASVLLMAVPSLRAAADLFVAARSAPFELAAFEVMTDACLDVVTTHQSRGHPFGAASAGRASPTFVLIEFEHPKSAAPSNDDVLSSVLQDWFEKQLASGTVVDGVIGDTSKKAAALWTLREGISESLAARGRVHKNDVSVPIKDVTAFVAALDGVYATTSPDLEVYIFGHMGDGNLHLNLVAPRDGAAAILRSDGSTRASGAAIDDATFFFQAKAADAAVYPLIEQFAGSVSAEHGVGTLKVDALRFTRGPIERRLMEDIKRTLDPKGILNPGKIFPRREPDST